MTSYPVFSQTDASKREEFKQYLDNAGVLDVLTGILAGLFQAEEKPSDALSYVKCQLNEVKTDTDSELESLRNELQTLKKKVKELQQENDDLKVQLEKLLK